MANNIPTQFPLLVTIQSSLTKSIFSQKGLGFGLQNSLFIYDWDQRRRQSKEVRCHRRSQEGPWGQAPFQSKRHQW